jgi:hypothetical protein
MNRKLGRPHTRFQCFVDKKTLLPVPCITRQINIFWEMDSKRSAGLWSAGSNKILPDNPQKKSLLRQIWSKSVTWSGPWKSGNDKDLPIPGICRLHVFALPDSAVMCSLGHDWGFRGSAPFLKENMDQNLISPRTTSTSASFLTIPTAVTDAKIAHFIVNTFR